MAFDISLFILAPLISLPLAFVISNVLYPGRLRRWCQLKYYQYEVSIGSYMLTPTERFILDSFFFLTLSLLIIAASLYLPEHIMVICRRAFYYYTGSSSISPGATTISNPATDFVRTIAEVPA